MNDSKLIKNEIYNGININCKLSNKEKFLKSLNEPFTM